MVTTSHAEDCERNAYPFEPNPPCFKECVEEYVTNEKMELLRIENLDPGVAVSISVLRGSGAELDSITSKRALEIAARNSFKGRREIKTVDKMLLPRQQLHPSALVESPPNEVSREAIEPPSGE